MNGAGKAFRQLALVFAGCAMIAVAEVRTIDKDDISVRETAILGAPLRLPAVGEEDITDAARKAVIEMRHSIGSSAPDEMPLSFAVMLNNPGLMVKQVALSSQLHNGELSSRDRELLILRTAWLNQAPYEWGEHVKVGKRVAGLSSKEIERITIGSEAQGWSEHDKAILKAVEELYVDAMISDHTWEILARKLNRAQLLELPVVVGTYQTIAYMQNSLRFPLREGNQGLNMR